MYHLTLQGCYADSGTLVVHSPIYYTAVSLSNALQSSYSCRQVILPGSDHPVTAKDMKFQICGQKITCFEIGRNVGPGCYCEEGYSLDNSGHCSPLSSCSLPAGQSCDCNSLDLSECKVNLCVISLALLL